MSLRRIFRRVLAILLWVFPAALAFAGASLYDSYLTAARGWGGMALLLAGLVGLGVVTARGTWRHGIAGKLLVLMWCLPAIALALATTTFQLRRQNVLQADGPRVQDLGRRFIVGYSSWDEIAPLAAKGLIAGVYITHRNIKGRTVEALRSDIANLQAMRRAADLPPLIVAADQEGGIVSHLSPQLTSLPALSTLTALPTDERSRKAEDFGRIHGRELASLGITLNFAPVVDLLRHRSRNPLDFHSLIRWRAISSDPAIATDIAVAYLRGLEAFGVAGTVKHFPGLGRIQTDTHHFRASLDTPLAELEATDWIPFRQTLTQSNAWLMVGHVAVAEIDPGRAASHSRAVVTDLIRGKWGHDGLIVTDDLAMGPIHQYGVCAATVDALNAGVDLLLIAYDGQQFYRVFDCALTASASGRIDETAMAKSIARLRARILERDASVGDGL